MHLLPLSISLVLYFVLHSLLASHAVKRLLQKRLVSPAYYRMVYNILALLLILPLVALFFWTEKRMLIQGSWSRYPSILLLLAGGVWVVRALRGYHLAEFIGTYQMKHGDHPEPEPLVTKGLNSQVRHPLYFGTLLAFWGAFLLYPTDASLVVAGISTVYIFVGSMLEERKMEQQFGEAYRSYQRSVPWLIPFKWRPRKK